MLNCLKQNKVVLLLLIGLIILLLIVIIIIIILVKKDKGVLVLSVIGISGLFITLLIGFFVRHYQDHIDNFKECIKKNKQDELAVINNLNKILSYNITIEEKANKIPEITDNGNNIIKLKTLQEHLYNRLKDLYIENKTNNNEIKEVKIYIKKVNSLIAHYNLKNPWFTRII